jgi:preprotein translocase subunit SecD
LLIVGGLVLLLVVVIAAGVVILVTRSEGNPTAEQSTPAARTKPSDPAAVEFRRVLAATAGTCPTPATAGTACDVEGMKYQLGKVELDGRNVSEVKAAVDAGSIGWYIALNLDPEGTKLFGQLTAAIAKQPPPTNQLAILVHGQVVTAPTVHSEISGGKVQISGSFTRDSAEALVAKIVG